MLPLIFNEPLYLINEGQQKMSQSHINQPYCLWKLFTLKVNF